MLAQWDKLTVWWMLLKPSTHSEEITSNTDLRHKGQWIMFFQFLSLHHWPTNRLPLGLKAHFVESVCDLRTGQNGSMAAVEVSAHRHGHQLGQDWTKKGRKNTEPKWVLSHTCDIFSIAWGTGRVTLFTCSCHIIRRLRRQVVERFTGELADHAGRKGSQNLTHTL